MKYQDCLDVLNTYEVKPGNWDLYKTPIGQDDPNKRFEINYRVKLQEGTMYSGATHLILKDELVALDLQTLGPDLLPDAVFRGKNKVCYVYKLN